VPTLPSRRPFGSAILADSLSGRTGKPERGIVIRAKPEDINLLTQLIDGREPAELAGIRGACHQDRLPVMTFGR
jgi:hypothetical protein